MPPPPRDDAGSEPPVELALLDRDGVITSTNAAWRAFGGPDKPDERTWGVGASYLQVCDSVDDEASRAVGRAIRAAVRGELVAPLTLGVPCALPNRVIPFDLVVSSRFDDRGICLGAAVSLQERLVSTSGLANILDLTPDGLVAVDRATGVVVYANRRLESLFGHRRSEIVGRPVEHLLPFADRDRHVADRRHFLQHPLDRAKAAGRLVRLHRPGGPDIPVDVSLAPTELDGRPVVLVAIRDLTDVRQLQDRERLVASALDRIEDGVVVLDVRSGRRVYANRSVLDRMGAATVADLAEVPIGAPPDEVTAAHIRATVGDLATGRRDRAVFDTTVPGHDGDQLPVEMSATFLPGSDALHDDGHVIFVTRDISARLATQRRLALDEKLFRSMFEESAVPTMLVRPGPGTRTIVQANASAAALLGVTRSVLTGADQTSVMRWEAELHPGSAVRTPRAGPRRGPHVARYRRRNGTVFCAAVHESIVEVGGPLGTATLMQVIDETERQALEELRERRTLVAALVARVATYVLSGEAAQDTHRRVIEGIAAALDATDAALWVPQVGPHPPTAATGRRLGPGDGARGLPSDVGQDVSRRLLRRSRARLPDLLPGGSPPGGGAGRRRLGWGIATRFRPADQARGALALWRSPDAQPFSDDELDLLAHSAHQLAMAVELGRGRAVQQRVLLLEERERLARDLHDTVLQDLIAAGMQLQAALPQIGTGPAVSAVTAAVATLEESIRQFRGAVFHLRNDQPPAAVATTVRDVVARAARALPYEPKVTVSGRVDLVPAQIRQQLDPVLREALSNVIRHAASTWCHVRVHVPARADALELTVDDDGVGPAPRSATGSHNAASSDGLRNLAARALALGGTSTLQPRLPAGSRLTWHVPLHDNAS